MVAIRRCLAERVPTRCAAQRSTPRANLARCAWERFSGVIIGRLVFAASTAQLATRIDQIMLTAAEVAAKAPFAPISITGGVLAEEAMALFPKK